MKVLITGISGFVGSHLAEHYVSEGVEVYGIVRSRASLKLLEGIKDQVKLIEGDITDAHSTDNIITSKCPDVIHHLAAQSFVPYSWANPSLTFTTNINGSLNILESVRSHSPETIVHVASSSEIYGNQTDEAITEDDLPAPVSPYAISKLTMDLLATQYHASYGTKTVITRTFNHGGPRRGENFVESKIAKAFASGQETIKLGNLEAGRDWTDVRDIVKAYALAVQKCNYGEPYNISSGKVKKIGDIINILNFYTNLYPKILKDAAFMRPSDVHYLLGDSSKFRVTTGWKPVIPFKKTIEDLYDYWKSSKN